MTTDEQTFQAELSAVVAWLTLHPADWCVYGDAGGEAGRLDVAVDADGATVTAILADLAGEGMQTRQGEYPHVAQVRGQRLRVCIHYGTLDAARLVRRTIRVPIYGHEMPVEAGLVDDWSRRAEHHRRKAANAAANAVARAA